MSTTLATLVDDLNDEPARCRACGRLTLGLVQVSLGDVFIGTLPLCEECQAQALDVSPTGPGVGSAASYPPIRSSSA